MTKLIRAEWYRFCHSGMFLVILLAGSLLGVFMSCMNDADIAAFLKLPFDMALTGLSLGMQSGLCIIVASIVAAACGIPFSNRTAYYEVMDGASISSIILSKLVVYVGAAGVSFLLPFWLLCAWLIVHNGMGEFHALPEFAVMVTVVFLHVITFCVFITQIMKSLAGAIFPYIRFMIIEMLGLEMIMMQEGSRESLRGIYEWFPLGQINALAAMEYPAALLMKTIVSFVLEFVILYSIAYVTYRKKLFVK